jgi:hypothetical protein
MHGCHTCHSVPKPKKVLLEHQEQITMVRGRLITYRDKNNYNKLTLMPHESRTVTFPLTNVIGESRNVTQS